MPVSVSWAERSPLPPLDSKGWDNLKWHLTSSETNLSSSVETSSIFQAEGFSDILKIGASHWLSCRINYVTLSLMHSHYTTFSLSVLFSLSLSCVPTLMASTTLYKPLAWDLLCGAISAAAFLGFHLPRHPAAKSYHWCWWLCRFSWACALTTTPVPPHSTPQPLLPAVQTILEPYPPVSPATDPPFGPPIGWPSIHHWQLVSDPSHLA